MNKNQVDNQIQVEELLNQCEIAERSNDFKKLIKLSDEVFKLSPDNQIAIGFKSFAYLKLKQYDEALELLEKGCKLYPKNHYLKNNRAMLYYDLGEYEKSLKCCEEGLKIKQFDWLCENKLKALIKLDRMDEAIEFYHSVSGDIENMEDLLIEAGKYKEALDYCFDEGIEDYEEFIDNVKDYLIENNPEMLPQLKDCYINWIYKIKYANNINVCPDCGGELIPIIMGFPSPKLLEKAENGEIFLGGCEIGINPSNFHCKQCGHEFNLGHEGLEIETSDLDEYIKYKIDELLSQLKMGPFVVVKSLNNLKSELKGFDDNEFNAFINHLKEINFITEPKEGYIKLVGFEDSKCIKEYLDEGKFPAPRWLVFPELSVGSMLWRMGYGENYAMNFSHPTEEFKKLFPKPRSWSLRKCEYKPQPPLGYFWSDNGQPEYSNIGGEIKVNEFITLDQKGKFRSDTFHFNSIEQAIVISKKLFFDRYHERDLKYSLEELWEIFKYSVCLNAAYCKIIKDDDLKVKLLETGDKTLIYESEDEWGCDGNLFGRALMEIRDEIRRLYANADKIDWEFSEYLKYTPW